MKLRNKLWNIKALGKMKITLWRMAHGCLSSGHQLRHRQILTSDACAFCSREERVEHTLLFCPYADEVWRQIKLAFPIHLQRKYFINTKVWLLDFLARSDDRELVTLVV